MQRNSTNNVNLVGPQYWNHFVLVILTSVSITPILVMILHWHWCDIVKTLPGYMRRMAQDGAGSIWPQVTSCALVFSVHKSLEKDMTWRHLQWSRMLDPAPWRRILRHFEAIFFQNPAPFSMEQDGAGSNIFKTYSSKILRHPAPF